MKKIIHCIWMGGEKTELAQKCRASWDKYAQDWEVREHGLSELLALERDGLLVPPYVKLAIETKKWAFVSDWFRFVVLEREGGVYFDFDVELVRPFTMALKEEGLWEVEWCAGEWLRGIGVGMAPGAGLALQEGSEVARKMLDVYIAEDFDGKTTVGDLMSKYGVKILLLPPDVMSPYDWEHKLHRTSRTIAVHHYALSWIAWPRRIARWLSWHGMGKLVQFLVKIKNG